MAALTGPHPDVVKNVDERKWIKRNVRKASATTVFAGAFCGWDETDPLTARIRPGVTDDPFAGVAMETVETTLAEVLDHEVRLVTAGEVHVPGASVVTPLLNAKVFLTDDQTLTTVVPGVSPDTKEVGRLVRGSDRIASGFVIKLGGGSA